jgi:hypothetical protein
MRKTFLCLERVLFFFENVDILRAHRESTAWIWSGPRVYRDP